MCITALFRSIITLVVICTVEVLEVKVAQDSYLFEWSKLCT